MFYSVPVSWYRISDIPEYGMDFDIAESFS